MEVRYHSQFNRDLRRLGNPSLALRVVQAIAELKAASRIAEVRQARRLRSEGQHYRIRVGGYRLGITMDDDTAVLRRFLPHGEFYRYFP